MRSNKVPPSLASSNIDQGILHQLCSFPLRYHPFIGQTSIDEICDWKAIEQSLAQGADPFLRHKPNIRGRSPLASLMHALKRYHMPNMTQADYFKEWAIEQKLFNLIKKYRPEYETMMGLLDEKAMSLRQFSVNQLSQDCLEKLNIYIKNKLHSINKDEISNSSVNAKWDAFDIEQLERIQDDIHRELQLINENPEAEEAASYFIQDNIRMNIIRILLLDTNLHNMFNHLLEEVDNLSLGKDIIEMIKLFVNEYEQKRHTLEELDAIPSPLQDHEKELAKKLASAINTALHQKPYYKYVHDILERKDSDATKSCVMKELQNDRESIINDIKKSERAKINVGLFTEIKNKTENIQSRDILKKRNLVV